MLWPLEASVFKHLPQSYYIPYRWTNP